MQTIDEVKSYNRKVSGKLREIFTPLCEKLWEEVSKINKDKVDKYLTDIKIGLVNYDNSKYTLEIKDSSAFKIENSNNDSRNNLNEKEKNYFYTFLKHLNEAALLKPYNLPELLTGRFKQYLWSPQYVNQQEANNHSADTTVIPIGEYGLKESLLMMLVTTILLHSIDLLKDEGKELEEKNWDILSVETFRGRKKREKINEGLTKNKGIELISTLDTFKEGVQSFQATISSLTAKKIDKLEFEQLLAKIIHMPQSIALTVPFNYTLPSIRQGIFFSEVFDHLENSGNLVFSQSFIEYCHLTQKLYRESRLIENGKRNPGLLGTGCPIGKKQNDYKLIGIDYIGQCYLYLYNLLSKTLDLQIIEQQIFQIEISLNKTITPHANPQTKIENSNVDEQSRIVAKDRVEECMQLQSLTEEVLKFWFNYWPFIDLPCAQLTDRWFAQSPQLDQEILERFGPNIEKVKQGKFLNLKRTPSQTLALIILLDQFSRNAYRNTDKAYESDTLAVKLALDLIATKKHLMLPPVGQWFVYMPLQHSEDINIQGKSVELFSDLLQRYSSAKEQFLFQNVLVNANQHRAIIKSFGRFPHRNKILQRESTKSEKEYLSNLKEGTYYNQKYFNKLRLDSTKSTEKTMSIISMFAFVAAGINFYSETDCKNKLISFLMLSSALYIMVFHTMKNSYPKLSNMYANFFHKKFPHPIQKSNEDGDLNPDFNDQNENVASNS